MCEIVKHFCASKLCVDKMVAALPVLLKQLRLDFCESSCVPFTNSGWSRCDYALAWDCINDASRSDAVSQTDYPALNPLLNPVGHTKASCVPSHQYKHVFTLMLLYSLLLLHKWRKDTFIVSQHYYYMPPALKTGWIRKGQQLNEGIQSWKGKSIIIICRLAQQPWESKYSYNDKKLKSIDVGRELHNWTQCSCFSLNLNWFICCFVATICKKTVSPLYSYTVSDYIYGLCSKVILTHTNKVRLYVGTAVLWGKC